MKDFVSPEHNAVKEEVSEKQDFDGIFLERGSIYLIPNHDSAEGYKVFANFVKSGMQGLCITRQNPEKIRDKYNLTKTPMIWLTKNRIHGQQVIDPSELFKIFPTVFDFINKEPPAMNKMPLFPARSCCDIVMDGAAVIRRISPFCHGAESKI